MRHFSFHPDPAPSHFDDRESHSSVFRQAQQQEMRHTTHFNNNNKFFISPFLCLSLFYTRINYNSYICLTSQHGEEGNKR